MPWRDFAVAMSSGKELNSYFEFTGRQRRDTALHTLEGFLEGIGMDHVINPREHAELHDWLKRHESLGDDDLAFRDLQSTLVRAMADGVLQPEEIADLKSLCQRAESTSRYYEWATHAMQELHGVLHGLIADLAINEQELRGLQSWLESYEDMKGLWPITEVESLVAKILADGRIDESEHRLALHFFSEFVGDSPLKEKLAVARPTDFTIGGICALAPEIQFASRVFCFTGISSKGPRKLFADTVVDRGGSFIDNVRSELDYLVIGDNDNPCWAYSCYGRKVERVIEMRRSGHRALIVHERDFWDCAS